MKVLESFVPESLQDEVENYINSEIGRAHV